MISFRIHQPRTKHYASVVLVVLLSGCASLGSLGLGRSSQEPIYPAPPFYLRAELDDPFSRIETATRQLTPLRASSVGTDRTQQRSEDLWGRVVSRFEFAQCDSFPEANAWARWFGERPEYIDRVIERARPWLHDIVGELEQREMPGELALLPIVESAYDPFAYSHGRAAGAWQFVASTALSHGIEINDYYDGRRDVYVATRAALGYLHQLNRRFDGDWNLALAAYNGGQGRVGRAIANNRKNNLPTDWQALKLPKETKAYIPKLHGLACLFRDAEDYGIELPKWSAQPMFEKIDLPGPTDVVILSALMDIDIAQMVALNPGLNQHLTSPTGPHHLLVPAGMGETAREILENSRPEDRIQYQSVTVKSGDTLSEIAQDFDIKVDDLKTHNGLTSSNIRIGQSLEIPTMMVMSEPATYETRYQELMRLQARLVPAKRFQHEVKPDESLWVIARRYRVALADLIQWNGLESSSLIKPGQKLTIVVEPPRRVVAQRNPMARYTVQSGDSLWLIARRHRISLQDLMNLNELGPSSVLQPGQTLNIGRNVASGQ